MPGLAALEARLLLPLRRAAEEATARLGLVPDPDRGVAAEDGAEDEVRPGMAGLAGPLAGTAADGSGPAAGASPAAGAPHPWPASIAPATPGIAPASGQDAADLAPGGGAQAPGSLGATPGTALSAGHPPPARTEDEASPAKGPRPYPAREAMPRAPRRELPEPSGPASTATPSGPAPAPPADPAPAPSVAPAGSAGPAPPDGPSGSGAAPAALGRVVLPFPGPRDGARGADTPPGRGAGTASADPPLPAMRQGVSVTVPPGQDRPRTFGPEAPASSEAEDPGSGRATSSWPTPATLSSAPAGAAMRGPPPAPAASAAAADPEVPPEPFAGLIPVRARPAPPAPGPGAAPVPAEPAATPMPAPALGQPMLGQVARAMQPVLSRAADLAEAAWDEAEPAARAPAISNTFNVTVAMSGGIGPADRAALQDALADLLRDAARRQGLDL